MGHQKRLDGPSPLREAALPEWLASARNRWLVIAAAAFVAIVPRLFFLRVPFERDEGCYAYVSDTINRGGLPYRDAFDHKPPGIYYIYNLSFKLFGRSVVAPRLAALLFIVAACVFTFLLVERMRGNFWSGLISMLFLGLSSAGPVYTGFDANTEIFTLPFLVAACFLLLHPELRPRHFFIAGILIGIGVVIKQVSFVVAAPAFICSAFRFRRDIRLLASISLLFTAGTVVPFALFALFFAAKGAFHDFWAGFYVYNRSYVAAVPWTLAWQFFQNMIREILKQDPFLWLAAAGGILLFFISRGLPLHRWFLAAILAGSFAASTMGRYFYGHYFIVMLPFLATGIGLGTSVLGRKIRQGWIVALSAVLFSAAIALQARFFTLPQDVLLAEIYGANPFYQSVGIGNFLRAKAKPGAKAYIIGSEGQILFYSGLEASSRIFYFYPLMYETPLRESFRSELLKTLRTHPPEFIIWINSPDSHHIPMHGDDPYLRTLLSLFDNTQAIGFSPFGSEKVQTDSAAIINGIQNNSPGSVTIYEKTAAP